MRVLGFDTETCGLDWWNPEQQGFLLSWADEDGSHVCRIGRASRGEETDVEGPRQFLQAVDRADVVVAHNLPFDIHQVRETMGVDLLDRARCEDTDVLGRVALPERAWAGGDYGGYKLKDLAKTYLRKDADDAEEAIIELGKSIGVRLKGENATPAGYYEVWRAYPREMEAYALLDAEYARDLYPLFLAKLNSKTSACWQLERKVSPVLIRAEMRGVRVDPKIVMHLRGQYEPIEAAARAKVAEELPDVNLASPVQLREALVAMGVPLYRKTDAGELSTNKFALQEFEDSFPVLKALGEWRNADRMLNTYVGPMTGREVVNTRFWQCGARTGRMSCSTPNMQNLPARSESKDSDTKLREVFVPREGHAFVVCDFDSIEVRLLAHYLNSPEYTQLIEDGLDPHAWMASRIPHETWGWAEPQPYEYFLKGAPGEEQRTIAKNVLFAIVYGAGANRVSDMLQISKTEARKLIKSIKMALPRYFFLKDRVDKKIRATGFVNTLLGRKACVNKEKSYVGVNALIQGSAADVFKQAVVDVAVAIAQYDAHLVLFVHDELVAEAPVEHAGTVLRIMTERMEAAYALAPSLRVTGSICLNNYAEGK